MPLDPMLLNGLEWRSLGPFRGGRVVAVAGDPVDRQTFYFGAAAGGVWKTTDGGTYWHNVSDGAFTTSAVGALAVAPSDPNVVYAGLGECCIRGDVSHGSGLYRSTDAGRSWHHLGLADTRHLARVRVHPHDPDTAWVAALGHIYGPHPDRGVYRTRDGGRSWERVLFRDADTGAIDLSLDPSNPRVLYAALWQTRRTPWSLRSGGPGSGLWQTVDGGDSWQELTRRPGLPAGILGRCGIAVAPSRPSRVYALIEAADGALFRSDDAGETWQRMSEQPDLRRRAWYYQHVVVDPTDADTVWVLDVRCWKSVDGGRTFAEVPTPHGDNHDLWIDPADPRRMIEGNDGGACVSYNGGASWSSIYNQPTAQFYHVAADTRTPYRIYGSQQDNTAISLPSQSARGAITWPEIFVPGGGESGYIAIKPDDPEIVIGGAIGSGPGDGRMIRYDGRTGQQAVITVWPEISGAGVGAGGVKYRFQWTYPLHFSRHDPNTLYAAAQMLLRSTDLGQTWEEISPDLTRNDPTKLEPSGGPITKDNTGAEYYCTIFAVAESPVMRGVLWAGTDDGLVHVSKDGGASWQNVTPAGLPEWALVSVIEPSPHDPATAYLAATRYRLDDPAPYLYKTDNFGRTWTAITTGIPADDFTRVIREDPVRRGLLFAGSETGVYVSFDDGASWQRLNLNLPVVPIYDLLIKDGDLLAATHGRGFWALDDITPLRELPAAPLSEPELLRPRTVTRFKVYRTAPANTPDRVAYRRAGPISVASTAVRRAGGEVEERLLDAGQNPPEGAVFHYVIPAGFDGDLSLTVHDAAGNLIRRFTSAVPASSSPSSPPAEVDEGSARSTQHAALDQEEGDEADEEPLPEPQTPRLPARTGLNRFVWNLRGPDSIAVPGDSSTESLLAGTLVPPGSYEVRLTAAGRTLTRRFEVRKDPRVAASLDDLHAQTELLRAMRAKLSETHAAINRLRRVREGIDSWLARAGHRRAARPAAAAARRLRDALTAVEDELIQARADSPLGLPAKLNAKLATLAAMLESADTAPPRQYHDVFADLSARIDAQLARLTHLLDHDLAALNTQIQAAAIPAIS